MGSPWGHLVANKTGPIHHIRTAVKAHIEGLLERFTDQFASYVMVPADPAGKAAYGHTHVDAAASLRGRVVPNAAVA